MTLLKARNPESSSLDPAKAQTLQSPVAAKAARPPRRTTRSMVPAPGFLEEPKDVAV